MDKEFAEAFKEEIEKEARTYKDRADDDEKKKKKHFAFGGKKKSRHGESGYGKGEEMDREFAEAFKEEIELEERKMTDAEMAEREEIVKKLKPKLQSFKDRYGDDAKKVMYATATKQAMEEFKIDEGWKKGKYKVTDGKTGKVLGTFNSGAKAQKYVDDIFQKGDYESLTVELDEAVEIEEKKSATGYELYHKTFSDAMQHAYAHAKSKGFVVDPKEIDDKVATGPKKPSSGKTNRYSLKAGRKKVEIQVANLDNKRYELNMYIEDYDKNQLLRVKHDEALIAETGDICALNRGVLRSKAMLAIWEKKCAPKLHNQTLGEKNMEKLVDTVRRVLVGEKEELSDKQKAYRKFFDKALKKFDIKSPADLKGDEEKKKFYDYIDKNWTAEHEEEVKKKVTEIAPIVKAGLSVATQMIKQKEKEDEDEAYGGTKKRLAAKKKAGWKDEFVPESAALQLKMAFDDAGIKIKGTKGGKLVISKKDKKKAEDVISKQMKKPADAKRILGSQIVFEDVELDEASNKKAMKKIADEIEALADKGGAEAPALFSIASNLRKGKLPTGQKVSKQVSAIFKKHGVREEKEKSMSKLFSHVRKLMSK